MTRTRQLVIPLLLAAATASASPYPDTMSSGDYLFAGGSLRTFGCYWEVTFQFDGNLVISDPYGRPAWASGTNGTGAGYATMQADGNFVLYRWDGTPVWATGTNGWGGAHVTMQHDGNLVVYSGSWPIWASGFLGDPGVGTTNCPSTRITSTEPNTNRFGGDYAGFPISQPRPLWCAYYCATDSSCKAYTYVPPGVQGANAMCWLKNSVPGTSYAPGLISGVVDDGL